VNVVIASIFRDSASYLSSYVSQVAGLRDLLAQRGDRLTAVWGEGDSIDRTAVKLAEAARKASIDCALIDVAHGGAKFGSVDVEQRWRQISYCCNTVLDQIPTDADVVMYVESDLVWNAAQLLDLIDDVSQFGMDAIAPMSMALGETPLRFYDTWGHRSGGVAFQPYAPFHEGLALNPHIALPLDSAGSCIVMRGEVARSARFDPPEMGIVGFGHDLNAKGYTMVLDPSTSVWHP